MSDQSINKDRDSGSSMPDMLHQTGASKDETLETPRVEGTDAHHIAAVAEGDDGRQSVSEVTTETHTTRTSRNRKLMIVAAVALIALVAVVALVFAFRSKSTRTEKAGAEREKAGETKAETSSEVKLTTEALAAVGIEVEGVTQRPAVALLKVTGTVETNQQQTQSVSPLVSGRVEQVRVALGDRVSAGTVLAIIASPEIAEMHGKLREAMTRLQSAEHNLQRVKRAENRVAVLQAKAKLDEAEANLKRVRRLIDLGAGAGKDLIAADTAYKTAKAEHDFQSNISFNREVQEVQAEVATGRVEVEHIRQSLLALGVEVNEGERDIHKQNISLVPVRAPVTGTVTERLVNPGAGIEAGKTLFTIANLSTVWVIANVPEAQVSNLQPGTPAEIRSAALGATAIAGRVNYIDPQLSEETRTARVRVEVANPNEKLKAGMFVEVGLQAGIGAPGAGEELMVPSAAVHRVGDRTVVFIPKEGEPGVFGARTVELGGEVEGYHRVLSGLTLGERVVTKGSFTLKTQMLKGEMESE